MTVNNTNENEYKYSDSTASETTTASGNSQSSSWDSIRRQYESDDITKATARQQAVAHLKDELYLTPLRGCDDLLWYDSKMGIYGEDGERVIKERLEAELGKHNKKRETSQILHKLRSQPSIPPEEFGTEAHLCLKNGVLDVSEPSEPTLKNHSPEFQCRKRLPVEYDGSADCPRFEKFIEESVKEEDRAKLQEFIGYTVFHHWEMPFQKAMMIVGPTATGKSTFLEVMTALLGENNVSHLSLQQMANQRFALTQARGSLANICNDLDDAVIENIGLFKQLTAGDPVEVDRKYKEPVTFEMTQKQIYATNRVPDLDYDDDAFYRRWIHIQFPRTIPKEERNPQLEETLKQELSGVLNWALKGYARLMENGDFTSELSTEEKRELWKEYGSSIDRFMQNWVECETGDCVPKNEVYSAYEIFCEKQGLPVKSSEVFSRHLQREYPVETCRPTIDGERTRCYQGITLHYGENPEKDTKVDRGGWLEMVHSD